VQFQDYLAIATDVKEEEDVLLNSIESLLIYLKDPPVPERERHGVQFTHRTGCDRLALCRGFTAHFICGM
jgi:hypothetical protein